MTTSPDSQTSCETAEVFTWTFPGAPVSVRLDSELIALLTRLASGPGGGLLFGTKSPGTLEITGCKPVAPEDGHLHKAIVDATKRLRHDENGRWKSTVVGYYRMQFGDRLALEPQDLDTISKAFSEDQDVSLLIKHERTGPPTAGFFFRTAEQLPSEFCFLEFPLDPAALPTERIERKKAIPTVLHGDGIPRTASTAPGQDANVEAAPTAAHQGATLRTAPGRASVAGARKALSRTGTRRRPTLVGWVALATALAVIGTAILLRSHPELPKQGGVSMRAPVERPIETTRVAPQAALGGTSIPERVAPAENGRAATPLPPLENRRPANLLPPFENSPNSNALTSGHITDRGPGGLGGRPPAEATVLYGPPAESTVVNRRPVQGPVLDSPVTQGGSDRISNPAKPDPASVSSAPVPVQMSRPSEGPSPTGTGVQNSAASNGPAFGATHPTVPPKSDGAALASNTVQRAPSGVGVEVPAPVNPPSGAAITEPQPVRQTQPSVPRSALKMLSKEILVSVQVQIDESGNVVQARYNAPPGITGKYFGERAVAAAKSWKFQPAKIGPLNVPSEKVLEFRFSPDPR